MILLLVQNEKLCVKALCRLFFPDWPRHLQCVEKPKRRVPQRAVPDRSVDDETSSEKEEESLREGQGDGTDEAMSDGERQSKDELTPDIAHDHSFYSKSMNSSSAGADGDDYVRKLEEELKLLRKRVIFLDNIKDSGEKVSFGKLNVTSRKSTVLRFVWIVTRSP